MKGRLLISFLTMIVVVAMASCTALHSGYMNDSAALSQPNFSYVKRNIQGSSTATYVLGIGGLGKETLVNSAKSNMMDEALLKDNQTLVNTTVNFKSSYYFGIIVTVKCTVTADVVEFK